MNTHRPKILVLGGTGAMGVYLIPELLDLGYEVFVTSRKERKTNEKRLHYILGDAKDESFMHDILEDTYDAIVDFMIYKVDEFESRVGVLLKNTGHYLFLSSYRVFADSKNDAMTEESARLLDTIKDKKYLETEEYGLSKARQENILKKQKSKKWTILRPTITYSSNRFQLGTMEAGEFLRRALNDKRVIFPKEMLDKKTTMTWGGDAAKMIALLILNKKTHGETFIVSTGEYKTWRTVLGYYEQFLDMKVKIVNLSEYRKVIGRPYQIKYDRMYDRKVDNSKILSATGLKQNDLMSIHDGLRMELSVFSKKPKFPAVDKKLDKALDKITMTQQEKIRKKISPRTRARQIRALAKSRIKYDGAIVTLTVYNNYGNIIQRYALQNFLKDNGYKFNMLNFHNGITSKNNKHLKKFVHKHLIQENFNPRLSKFYKTYIVGSDQVWRHFSVNKGWGNFGKQFLSFVTSKSANRIAYAASFGLDTLEGADIVGKRVDKVTRLMKKFNAISVREESGKKLVKDLGGKSAIQVLDPTLLLPYSSYSLLIDKSKIKSKKTSKVFYYLIDPTPLVESTIKKYETQEDELAEGILPYRSASEGVTLPSMEEWLKSIRDASIVIADSYHAVVFSIIFHTPFIVFNKKGGGLARISELLKPLNLEDRIIIQENVKSVNLKKIKAIDWSAVDKALDAKRKESAEWLIKAIEKKHS